METFIIGLAQYLTVHPEYAILVSTIQTLLIIASIKYYLTPAKTMQSEIFALLKEHSDKSTVAEKDISTIKDIINESKGLLAGLSMSNRGIK